MDPRRSPQPRHHTPPLPPPPPSPPATSSSDVRRRGPGQLPSITTALTAAQRFQTHLRPTAPASAHPTNTTFSPLSTSPVPSSASAAPSMASGRGSSSATSPYNPQEWSRNTPVSGSYMPHGSARNSRRAVAPRDMTGMECMCTFTIQRLLGLNMRTYAQHSMSSLRLCSLELSTYVFTLLDG